MEKLVPQNDAKFFREYRKRVGLTQHKLAKLSRVDRTIIANIEAGRRTLTGPVAKRLWAALESASHSPSNAERLHEFRLRYLGLSKPPLSNDARELFELNEQTAQEAAIWKHKLDFFEKWLNENVTAKKIEELEAFKENTLALADEHLPKIASTVPQPDKDPLAFSKAKAKEEKRKHGFREDE